MSTWFHDRPWFAMDLQSDDPGHAQRVRHDPSTGEHIVEEEPVKVEIVDTSIRSWSAVDSALFYGIRDALLAEWADQIGVDVRDLPLDEGEMTQVLREYGSEVFRSEGAYPEDLFSVRDDPAIWTRMVRAGNGSDLLPSTFNVLTDQGTVLMRNTAGMTRPEIFRAEDTPTSRIVPSTFVRGAFPRTPPTGGDPLDEKRFRAGQTDSFVSDPLRRGGGAFVPTGPAQQVSDRPDFDPQDQFGTQTVSIEDLQRILQGGQTVTTTSSSGGRGDLTLDRDRAAEQIRNQWRTWMREEPDNLDGLVSEFESSAQAFWQAGGGQKDLATWVKNRMRSTSRYDMLYGKKDESQSEEEYLQGFLSAEQFGLDPRIANREVVRGLTTGAAPASFTESVAFGRDVQALGQGTFSRRFAQMIDGLGSLQRA